MIFEIGQGTGNLVTSDYDSLGAVPILDGSTLVYGDFFRNYMLPNVPCIIKAVTNNWECSQRWLVNNKPNFDYLQQCYGSSNVTIYNCLERYYNCQKTRQATFSEYLNYFRKCDSKSSSSRLDYLKNWHLQLSYKDDHFYEVPIFFASDWLNEYYTNCLDDDYRFVYMGPKHTWTPFHVDVFSSFSWSANICGKKKWMLFPPGAENKLKDYFGNLPYDINDEVYDGKKFEVIQDAGDAIFVPSGWHHQVWNLEDTISINHNWVNGCNLNNMFNSLKANLEEVVKEIEDLRGMDNFEEHCQVMLNASFGMDYYKFYEFLKYIALVRIGMFKAKNPKILFHSHEIGRNHILFDLNAIKTTLGKFIASEEVNNLEHFKNVDVKPAALLNQIVAVLKNS